MLFRTQPQYTQIVNKKTQKVITVSDLSKCLTSTRQRTNHKTHKNTCTEEEKLNKTTISNSGVTRRMKMPAIKTHKTKDKHMEMSDKLAAGLCRK